MTILTWWSVLSAIDSHISSVPTQNWNNPRQVTFSATFAQTRTQCHAKEKETAQAMFDAGTPGVGVMWITFMYGEMNRAGWQSQSVWMQGFMYSKELGPSNEVVLCSVLADTVGPEAVLGLCPVDVQPECKSASPSRQCSHYWCTTSKPGAIDDWGKLLFDSTVEQYGDMYSERPPRELEQFIHSYRLPHPNTYKSMLTMSAARGISSVKLVSNLDHEFEPSSKRRRCEEDVYLRRIRSLVQPLQVEVVTKAPLSGGSAVEIHRYMAAGSCIGVEVWQPSGLLGEPLEAELSSLVQHWEVTDAADYVTSVVDSPTAKRRKVYFGCRDIHNDPQLHWDVEPVPTVITDRLLPRLVQLGVINAVSDVHQAVLNMYHKGGYLVAHQDSQAHYQQPVVMIQVCSESALSFGYKPGGWSHVNENLRFLRIHKPLFSVMVLKNEAFNMLKHCVCSGDTQSGQCTTLVLRSITPSQKP
ncbi:TPA: RNA demethylase alkbh5 [Trebouxia sp. C0004]